MKQPKVKEECLKCGYWIKTLTRRYKCYTNNCPAKFRDQIHDK